MPSIVTCLIVVAAAVCQGGGAPLLIELQMILSASLLLPAGVGVGLVWQWPLRRLTLLFFQRSEIGVLESREAHHASHFFSFTRSSISRAKRTAALNRRRVSSVLARLLSFLAILTLWFASLTSWVQYHLSMWLCVGRRERGMVAFAAEWKAATRRCSAASSHLGGGCR